MADFFFFLLQVALGTGEGVALLLDEVKDDFELLDVLRREAPVALAGLERAQELELLLPVPDKAGGDAEKLGHFGD